MNFMAGHERAMSALVIKKYCICFQFRFLSSFANEANQVQSHEVATFPSSLRAGLVVNVPTDIEGQSAEGEITRFGFD